MPNIKCQMNFLSNISNIGKDNSLVGILLKDKEDLVKQAVYIELRDDGFYIKNYGLFLLTDIVGIYKKENEDIYMSILSYRSSLQTVQEFNENFDMRITEVDRTMMNFYQQV